MSAPRPGCSCRSIAAKSWARVKANLPTVRIDEITLHPRDNAMILATHGRAIWILDHLEPIQEYAAAQAAAADAKLFTPPPYRDVPAAGARSELRVLGRPDVLRREPAAGGDASRGSTRSRSATSKLKITDAAGREVREISRPALADSNQGRHPGGVLGSARAAGTRRRRLRRARGTRQAGRAGRARTAGRTAGGGAAAPSPFGCGLSAAQAAAAAVGSAAAAS